MPPGAGLMEVHVPVPQPFALAEGTNLRIESTEGSVGSRFTMRGHVRGAHPMPPATAEIIDPAGLLAPRRFEIAPAETIEVTPRTARREDARVRRAQSRIRAQERGSLGVRSTDFRELREYAWGDPPKAIDWKATARRLSSRAGKSLGGTAPLVKEYETEGRQTALVLLDGGEPLRIGTTVETGLDHAVEAALTIAARLLDRGARVGAATYHAKGNQIAPPEAGSSQVSDIERALSPGDEDAEFAPVRALQRLEPHFQGARPLLVVVTRVTPQNADELSELGKRFRAVLRERRTALPLVVLDVRALGIVPVDGPAWRAAVSITQAQDAAAARRLEREGMRVVRWRPGHEDLRLALAREGLA